MPALKGAAAIVVVCLLSIARFRWISSNFLRVDRFQRPTAQIACERDGCTSSTRSRRLERSLRSLDGGTMHFSRERHNVRLPFVLGRRSISTCVTIGSRWMIG